MSQLDLSTQELPLTAYFSRSRKENNPIIYLSKKRRLDAGAGEDVEAGPSVSKKTRRNTLKDASNVPRNMVPQSPNPNRETIFFSSNHDASGSLSPKDARVFHGFHTPSVNDTARHTRRNIGKEPRKSSSRSMPKKRAQKMNEEVVDLTDSNSDRFEPSNDVEADQAISNNDAPESRVDNKLSLRTADAADSTWTSSFTAESKKNHTSRPHHSRQHLSVLAKSLLPTPNTSGRKPPALPKQSWGVTLNSPSPTYNASSGGKNAQSSFKTPISTNPSLSTDFDQEKHHGIADTDTFPAGLRLRSIAGILKGPSNSSGGSDSSIDPFSDSLSNHQRRFVQGLYQDLVPTSKVARIQAQAFEASALSLAHQPTVNHTSVIPNGQPQRTISLLEEDWAVMSSQSQYLLPLEATPTRSKTEKIAARNDLYGHVQDVAPMPCEMVPSSQSQGVDDDTAATHLPSPLATPFTVKSAPEPPCHSMQVDGTLRQHQAGGNIRIVQDRKTDSSSSTQIFCRTDSLEDIPLRSIDIDFHEAERDSTESPSTRKKPRNLLSSQRRNSGRTAPDQPQPQPDCNTEDDSATESESETEILQFVAELSRRRPEHVVATSPVRAPVRAKDSLKSKQILASSMGEANPSEQSQSEDSLSFFPDEMRDLVRAGAPPSIDSLPQLQLEPYCDVSNSLPSVVGEFLDMFDSDSGSSYPTDE